MIAYAVRCLFDNRSLLDVFPIEASNAIFGISIPGIKFPARPAPRDLKVRAARFPRSSTAFSIIVSRSREMSGVCNFSKRFIMKLLYDKKRLISRKNFEKSEPLPVWRALSTLWFFHEVGLGWVSFVIFHLPLQYLR